MSDVSRLGMIRLQSAEFEAWQLVVDELRKRQVADIESGGADERLHDAIVLWGEELAQLRLGDPDETHAQRALAERRAKWETDA